MIAIFKYLRTSYIKKGMDLFSIVPGSKSQLQIQARVSDYMSCQLQAATLSGKCSFVNGLLTVVEWSLDTDAIVIHS